MQNGPNGSVLLRNATEALPTHLIVVNLDPRLHDAIEEMAAFLPAFGVTILHAHDGEDASVQISEINEAQMIRMMPDLSSIDLGDPYPWARATYRFHRPALMHALRTAFKNWAEDRKQDRTVILFAGAPRTPVEAALLGELPLDTQALFYRRCGALPLVLRFLIAPRRPPEFESDLPLAHLLADLEQTYFTLPDYPQPFQDHADIERPSSSPFDTTVWVDGEDGTELVHLLRSLLRLHGAENARLVDNFPTERGGGRPPPRRPLRPSTRRSRSMAKPGRSTGWRSVRPSSRPGSGRTGCLHLRRCSTWTTSLAASAIRLRPSGATSESATGTRTCSCRLT